MARCAFVVFAWLLPIAATAAESIRAMASIPPVATIVQRIGGEHVAVESLVETSQDPHTFEPAPRKVAAMAKAHFFFTVGFPFEAQLLGRVEKDLRETTIVDATRGFARYKNPHHEHAPGHDCGADDPHVWLSPEALSIMATNVADVLQKADPEHRAVFEENLKTLRQEINALDARLAARLKPWRGRTIYVYHPALGYFCAQYGLAQKAVEIGGRGPAPRQLRVLIQQARSEGVKVIFVQKQFDSRAAETVARAIGGRVVPMDPLDADVVSQLDALSVAIDGAMRE
ncbi:MAG: zinc ABC transporter substrate-binding protein [Pirellulales bacterium]|nr:zinc ABC transporter substrate-binding protein [Pirellulales bacterium]